LFATLALNIALYSLFSAMEDQLVEPDVFRWLKLFASVSLPATAQRFFRAFLGDEAGPPPLSRSTVAIAGMFYLALFFNSLVASTAIIILYEPLRSRVDRLVNRWMFQEKFELFRRIENLRNDLMNVIDVRDLVPRVLAALEDSRRVTHAALYVVDPDGSGYELAGHIGPKPDGRLDAVANRAFLERLRRAGVVSIEGLERELAALKNKQ